uniref:Uncharacterized protein n=1 Tax=Setaria italica TaxID=4555 RepID=K4AKK9_SETIT
MPRLMSLRVQWRPHLDPSAAAPWWTGRGGSRADKPVSPTAPTVPPASGGSQAEELECLAAPSAPPLTLVGAPSTPQLEVSDVSPTPLRVYSWQRRIVKTLDPPTTDDTPLGLRPASPIQKLSKVCKPVDSLLPLLVIQKRRRKVPSPGSLPRRSRRVAGAGPCSPRLVKRVMRHLGFSDREVIESEAQDRYCKLYKPLLSESHVSAIVAIFGWTVGEGDQVRSIDVLTVL